MGELYLSKLEFLSTLSLRRATCRSMSADGFARISIHALLAESDGAPPAGCRDRRAISIHALLAESDVYLSRFLLRLLEFLSTLSLRRATPTSSPASSCACTISIHALLAESDGHRASRDRYKNYFYPRSPCGERPVQRGFQAAGRRNFYPRSPCGERPGFFCDLPLGIDISIHALLAESDPGRHRNRIHSQNFYPRSPCGERPGPAPTAAAAP